VIWRALGQVNQVKVDQVRPTNSVSNSRSVRESRETAENRIDNTGGKRRARLPEPLEIGVRRPLQRFLTVAPICQELWNVSLGHKCSFMSGGAGSTGCRSDAAAQFHVHIALPDAGWLPLRSQRDA